MPVMAPDPPASAPVVVLVGGDLQARARVESAAAAAGMRLVTASEARLEDVLRSTSPAVVVLDLDRGGRALLETLAGARRAGVRVERLLGFYSHVDSELGDAARRAGCEALPRGRFWRSAAELLGGRPETPAT